MRITSKKNKSNFKVFIRNYKGAWTQGAGDEIRSKCQLRGIKKDKLDVLNFLLGNKRLRAQNSNLFICASSKNIVFL